eukprot:374479-Alexandrium_andersonii.AAC.1
MELFDGMDADFSSLPAPGSPAASEASTAAGSAQQGQQEKPGQRRQPATCFILECERPKKQGC